MRIQHNISALNTHRNLAFNNAQTSKALEKLSSGYKINRAGDDAAGLAISEKMRGQIRGLDMASKNAQDGISLIQTAEGALNETHSILQRMRELAVQAGNDTNTTGDREEIQKEINQLTSEINRIGNTTEFNTKKLVNGELSENYSSTPAQKVDVSTAADKSYKVGDEPITWSNANSKSDIKIDFSGNTDNSLNWKTIAAAEKAGLTADNVDFKITKTADNTFVVDAKIEDSGTNKTVITAAEVAYDPQSKAYTYDNQGVKFSFTDDDVKNWQTGESVTVDLTKVGQTAPDFQSVSTLPQTAALTHTTATGTQAEITKFDLSGSTLEGLAKAEVSYAVATKTLSVDLKDKNNVSLGKYEVKDLDANTAHTFKAEGIEMTLNTKDSSVFSFSVALEQDTTEKTVAPADVKNQSVNFQIGANKDQAIAVSIGDMRASALGITTTGTAEKFGVTDGTDNTVKEQALDITDHKKAAQAIKVFDEAIAKVSAERSKLGAVQNRLEHTINNLGTSAENLTAAESRIRDTDMAASMMEFTKNNILTQAAQSMLAQANQQPQGVLQLLG